VLRAASSGVALNHVTFGARRHCTALLGRHARKWNARDVIAQAFAS